MKMFFRSIQKWMKERKVRRELKKDQALSFKRTLHWLCHKSEWNQFFH